MKQILNLLIKCINDSPSMTKLRTLLKNVQIKPKSFIILINPDTDECYINELKTHILPTSVKHTCPVFSPSLLFPMSHGNWKLINLTTRSVTCGNRIVSEKNKNENNIIQCVPTNIDVIGDLDALKMTNKTICSAILGPDYISLYSFSGISLNNASYENIISRKWKSFLNEFENNKNNNNNTKNVENMLQKYYTGISILISKI